MSKAKLEMIRKFAAEQGIEIVELKVKRVSAKALTGLPKFKDAPVEMVERTNAMTGKKFMEAKDTPFFASASSETYWCS